MSIADPKDAARTFWPDESGAVTTDWVVLSAVALSIGLSAMTAVRTGTVSLTNNINFALASGYFFRDAYSFRQLSEQAQADALALFESLTAEQQHARALELTAQFRDSVAAGDLGAAAAYMDQQYLLATAMDADGLSLGEGAMSVADMAETLESAQPG